MANLTWRADALHRLIDRMDEHGLLAAHVDTRGKTVESLIAFTVDELVRSEVAAAKAADKREDSGTLAAANRRDRYWPGGETS